MLSVLLFVSAVCAAPYAQVRSERADVGPLRSRVLADDADVVVFYGGEQHGKLSTCGCRTNPRGSVGRVAGYVRASRRANPTTPDLLVNSGNWLDDATGSHTQLRPDVDVRNRWMRQAVVDWTALNISFRDLPWLAEEPAMPAGAVSANVSGPAGPAPYLIVQAGEHRVGVTGVSALGRRYLQPDGYRWRDPVVALRELLPELRSRADTVVVLAYETWDQTDDLAALPGVDVVIEAGSFKGREQAVREGRAVWVRSHWQTEFLGELRLWLDAEGRVLRAVDRKIELDSAIPSPRAQRRLERDAQQQIDAALVEVFGDAE